MVSFKSTMLRLKETVSRKPIKIAVVSLGILLLAGGGTYVALALLNVGKNGRADNTKAETAQQSKERAAAESEAEAKKLIDELAKKGSGDDATKVAEEAIDKFKEAGAQYEQAGKKHDSIEAAANADALQNQLAAEEVRRQQLEADRAKQQAAYDAAKAAMSANN